MKLFFNTVFLLIITAHEVALSQDTFKRLDYPNGYPVRLREPGDIQGSPYLFDNWQQTDLLLKDSTVFANVTTRFNIYDNKIYFLKDDQELECVSPVWQFSLIAPTDQGSGILRFRCGYPGIDANTEKTYYQVVVDGKFQLLRRIYKYLDERGGYSGPKEKVYQKEEKLYAWLPGQKMIRLTRYKEDLMAALPPEYQSQINKIESSQKLKLRKIEDLVLLFNALNNP